MAMTLISRTTLTGTAASVTFSSIPQTYQTLKLVVSARSSDATSSMGARINTDAGNNYSYRRAYGNGSSAVSGNGSSQSTLYVGDYNGNGETSNTFASVAIDIPNYFASSQKAMSVDWVTENNATLAYAGIAASLWSNTSGVSSLSLTQFGGAAANFIAGSTFSLYGLS